MQVPITRNRGRTMIMLVAGLAACLALALVAILYLGTSLPRRVMRLVLEERRAADLARAEKAALKQATALDVQELVYALRGYHDGDRPARSHRAGDHDRGGNGGGDAHHRGVARACPMAPGAHRRGCRPDVPPAARSSACLGPRANVSCAGRRAALFGGGAPVGPGLRCGRTCAPEGHIERTNPFDAAQRRRAAEVDHARPRAAWPGSR